jgi:NADH-quinone oxidoreductase subunit N
MMDLTTASWALAPELIMALGAMALLMVGVFRPENDRNAELIGWLAVGVLGAAAWMLLQQPAATQFVCEVGAKACAATNAALIVDPFARFMKLLALAGSAGALLLSFDHMREGRYLKFEYPVLVLLATCGMLLMISANDLIALYLGLELQSLALYVVAAIRRDNVRSSEAGLKYFVLGALSSGMLLYGASLIYGFTGSTNFATIASVAKAPGAGANIGLIFGLVFLLVGLAFKISAVPFHMWTPDVYEGAPTPVTALFASAPKAAAMALLVRVVVSAFGGMKPQWQQVIVALSIASMALGAFAAIGQTNIKRLLAYSSIANMGFALVGLAAGTPDGVQGVLIYMAIYLVMTLGAFACVLAMKREGGPVETIEDLAGASETNGGMAAALAVLMFSLAGIPPLAGFFGKFYVFLAAVDAKLWTLAVLGVLASVVGAYYYLRIVKIMYFDEPKQGFVSGGAKQGIIYAAASVAMMIAFLPMPSWILSPGRWLFGAAQAAAKSLF